MKFCIKVWIFLNAYEFYVWKTLFYYSRRWWYVIEIYCDICVINNLLSILLLKLFYSVVGKRYKYVPKTQHSSTPQSSELWHPRNDGLLGYAVTVATKIVTTAKDNFPILLVFILTSIIYIQNLKTKNIKSAFT